MTIEERLAPCVVSRHVAEERNRLRAEHEVRDALLGQGETAQLHLGVIARAVEAAADEGIASPWPYALAGIAYQLLLLRLLAGRFARVIRR